MLRSFDKIPVEIQSDKAYSDTAHVLWMTRENAHQFGAIPAFFAKSID
jgi:hypothetical protein